MARRMSDIKKPVARKKVQLAKRYQELDLICHSNEQILQIRGVQNALTELVERCVNHLDVSLAIVILRDKGINIRRDSSAHSLDNAARVIRELERDLDAWLQVANKNVVVSDRSSARRKEILPGGSCKSLAAPILVSGNQVEGILFVANGPDSPDFGKREQTLLQAIAANIARIMQARYDNLTGLINRMEFEYRLGTILSGKNGKSASHCVLHLDLDDMKTIEESLGHQACDQVIRQVALLLSGDLDGMGPVARIGDDEYGILIGDCSLDQGWCIGQDIRRAIGDLSIVWDDRPIKLTVSIGVARLAAESDTVESALAAAKIACIVAKDRGRDRVALYQHHDAMLLHSLERMQGVEGIQQALRDDNFYLYCQRIQPLRGRGKSPHFEILLRGIDHDGKPIAPSEFLSHAEHSRLMPAIDRWVIRQTLDLLGKHRVVLTESKSLFAINLSGQSLCDSGFLDFVAGEFARADIPPQAICFEITETAAILDMNRAAEFMAALKKIGCHFSLDDFGAGLSSFSYFKTLPIDFLKIDGQFITEILDDEASSAIVEAITRMSHAMGVQTIAEYVKNNSIKAHLKEIGVDYVQGYGIARPRPLAEELESLAALLKPAGKSKRA
ncbi:MAG: EAL domain-containing protein [Proteobacteria bacterium]|nr:EAL domain-containing protein [Pseudomonadota bacterium]